MADPEQTIERDMAAAWASLPVVAAVLFLVQRVLAPWIPHENPTDAATLFLKELLSLFQPERLEHIRYLLALATTPIAFIGVFLWARRFEAKAVFRFAFVGQGVLVLAFFYARRTEEFAYFTPGMMLLGDALTLAICLAVVMYGAPSGEKIARAVKWIPQLAAASIALLLTAALLSPSVIRDREVYLSSMVLWWHMEYTASEFFGVASGKTPMVNFFPQYNNVLPVLLAPVLNLTGYTFLAFTTAMVSLSLAGLMAVYWTLSMLTRHASIALALYLPVLGLSFGFGGSPAWGMGIFNYFAVWPMRYVWPLWLLAAVTWTLHRPAGWRWMLVGVVAGVGAINNLDFGAPALAGAAAAIVLSRTARLVPSLLSFIGGVAIAFAAVQIGFFLRSNAWPDFGQAATYSKIFGLYGFGMIPLPLSGLYWTILFTYMACLFAAIVSYWRGGPSSPYAGVLAFVSIFGCGSFMYYVGRSHPHVLGAVFFTWAVAVVLLLYGFQKDFGRAWLSHSWYLAIIPGLLLLTHSSLFAVLLWPNSKPIIAQLERRSLNDVQGEQQRQELKAFMRRNAKPTSRIMLILPMGHKIAFEERLRNYFPFPHPGSIILKAQAEQVEKTMVAKKVTKVFILQEFEREEQQRILQKLGFQLKESFAGVNLWTRKASPAPAP
ncbi:MAG TPA: hypothetical protein VK993_07750 [Chthoniobacterales bacterium]|nr:hypothetical protein [Chthoniobacterales bacterium]